MKLYLDQLEVTVSGLLETGTGKITRSLKDKGGRVAELAKKLGNQVEEGGY